MVSRVPASTDFLPARRLLAVLLEGTAEDDHIIVTSNLTHLVVELNGAISTYPLAETDDLTIVGADGDDTIDLRSTGGVPVSVNGGSGSDELRAGGGDLAAIGNVTLRGGDGFDRAVVDNSLAPAISLSITNPFNLDTRFTTRTGTISVDAGTPESAVESIDLLTGSDADQVTLLGPSSLSALRIYAGGGDDLVTVGDDFDSFIHGAVTVDGDAGANTLQFDDSADGSGDTYTFGGSGSLGTIGKNTTANVLNYTNVSTLDVLAGTSGAFPNNQFFRVNYLPPAMHLTINAGTGDDALTVGAATIDLASLQSSIIFNGDDGFDRVEVFDTLGTDPATYTVLPTLLQITGQQPIGFTDIQFLVVRGNAGPNLFDVESTQYPTSVTLDGGAGDDEFHLGAGDVDSTIGNSVSVIGGAGTDYLVIDDSLDDPGNDTYTFTAGLMTRAVTGIAWSTAAGSEVNVVELLGSANPDTLRINAASASVRLRIDAGDGDDTILANRTTDAAGNFAPVYIASGAGNDSLSVNSDNSGADASVTVDAALESLTQLTLRAGGRLTVEPEMNRILRVMDALDLTGTLDLNDQTLIVANRSLASVDALVAAGFDGGTWAGAGPAIVSGTASQSPGLDALASVTAESVGLPVYDGVATSAGDIIVRYTLFGDADLDRTVGFNDLLVFAQAYDPSAGGRTWAQGNFTYSNEDDVPGAVGFDDLLLLAQNYGKSIGGAGRSATSTRAR